MIGALLSGLLFGAGLLVSGMANPDKVLGFLDIAGPWDPSLAVVMATAVPVAAVGYALARRRVRPLRAPAFHLPTARRIDGRLLAGAALFGIGWGLAGYCPGPGLLGLVLGQASALLFVPALLAGMALVPLLGRRQG